MKTLLLVSLCSVTLVLTSFGQAPSQPQNVPPPARPPAPPAPALNPTVPAAQNPAVPPPAATAPVTNPVVQPPTTPGAPPVTGTTPVTTPGMTPGMTPASSPTGPVASVTPLTTPAASPAAPAASPAPAESANFFIHNFQAGGYIMWPILVVSIVALAVVLERIFWWLGRWMRRDPKRIEKVFTAIETGDVAEASRLSRGSRDPVLRMMWNGLNHQHASLQGALQVAAGIEIKRAGRFLVVMDTLVTLAPLLGLLGTITGLMKAFGALKSEEIAVVSVTGGIAEALIATACGLGIAIFALIPFNFFTSRVSNLEFELQTAATNLEVMLEAQNKAQAAIEISGDTPTSATRSSI